MRTVFISGFVGNSSVNFAQVEIAHTKVEFHSRRLDLVLSPMRGEKEAGKGLVTMGIRPEGFNVSVEGIPGEVDIDEPLGRDHLTGV